MSTLWLFNDEAKVSEIITVIFLLSLGFLSVLIAGTIPPGEDAFENFVFLATAYFLSGIAMYSGYVIWRELRLIRNTPTSKIRSMPMGTVEVKGTAEQGPEGMILESPFSDEKSLFYRWEVKEYRDRGKNSSWVTIDSGYRGVRFVLDDGTGDVIVDPDGAEIEIPLDNEIRINSSENESEEIKEFMDEEGISSPGGLIGDNDRKYREWYVKPGEDVYIFGYASNEKDQKGEYPIIKDHERAEMFVISDKSERELTKKKRWKSSLAMYGGALGTLVFYGLQLIHTGVL